MAETRTISLWTAGVEADRQLVRSYVLDALDRFSARDECRRVGFVPLGRKAHLDGMDVDGGVLIRLTGSNLDDIVEAERERWDDLVSDGLVTAWETGTRDDLDAFFGEDGVDLYFHLEMLASQLSGPVYEALDDRLDPVDEYPTEDRESPTGVGWWRLLHLLTIQQNYTYADEVDAFTEGIRFALSNIARFDDPDRAAAKTDEVLATLESIRAELDDLDVPNG